jgi:curved DNA-binding protein CbpA
VVDYYALLGLDPGASAESIKVAYRRLAREHHPDRNIGLPEAGGSTASLRMAQLNEAYAVLSDAKKKREYDENLRLTSKLQSSTVSSITQTATKSDTRQTQRARHSRSQNIDPTMAREFAKQLRNRLIANCKDLTWKEQVLEGFDWGLKSFTWSSHYCVAGRGFVILDPPAARKFATYSEIAVTRFNRSIRKSYFLFLLAFQQLSDWESISTQFHRLLSKEGFKKLGDVPIQIILLDVQQGKVLRIGGQLAGKGFERLFHCMGTFS